MSEEKGFSDAYQAAFASRRIVIVLTQTASATNGVNLDFNLPESGKKYGSDLFIFAGITALLLSAFQANAENNDDMAHAGFQLRNWKNCSVLVKFSSTASTLPSAINDEPKI